MSADAYLFSISRTDAEGLQQLRREVAGDAGLDDTEKRQLEEAVDLRFGQLNLQAAGARKPRWE